MHRADPSHRSELPQRRRRRAPLFAAAAAAMLAIAAGAGATPPTDDTQTDPSADTPDGAAILLGATRAMAAGDASFQAVLETPARGLVAVERLAVERTGAGQGVVRWQDVTVHVDGGRATVLRDGDASRCARVPFDAPLIAALLGLPDLPLAPVPQIALAAATTEAEVLAAFATAADDAVTISGVKPIEELTRWLDEVTLAHADGETEIVLVERESKRIAARIGLRGGLRTKAGTRPAPAAAAATRDRASAEDLAARTEVPLFDLLALKTGDPLPVLGGRDSAGAPQSIDRLRAGRAAIVHLFGTGSAAQRSGLPALREAAETGSFVAGVECGDADEELSHAERAQRVKTLFAEHGLALPVLFDEGQAMRRALRADVLPMTFKVDSAGRIASIHHASDGDLASWLQQ